MSNRKTEKINLKKGLLIICGIIVALIFATAIIFFVYASDYYRADETALQVYETGIENGTIEVQDNLYILYPETSNSLGIIFYPGAKVEAIAYIPLLQQLADEGFTVVLVEMPFNFAFFNVNGANDVFEIEELVVDEWYMMGHSLGGGMASSYASDNQDLIDGLILIGAYVYGDYPTDEALTIYGSFNDNLEENIDYTDNIVLIDGGNHAQFGNYGAQEGDPEATITDVEQQEITVEAILEFVEQE